METYILTKKLLWKYKKTPFYSIKLVCNNNLQKRGGFYYKLLRIYYYKIEKTLEKMIILSTPRLNNLIEMIIGIITSQSVVLSKISQELKDCYSLGTEESKIKKLDYITPRKEFTKYFYNIKLTAQEYVCNMAVWTAEDSEDVWFIDNNISEPYAIREYKKRFNIEEMFRDFKSGGFNLEDTWAMIFNILKCCIFVFV